MNLKKSQTAVRNDNSSLRRLSRQPRRERPVEDPSVGLRELDRCDRGSVDAGAGLYHRGCDLGDCDGSRRSGRRRGEKECEPSPRVGSARRLSAGERGSKSEENPPEIEESSACEVRVHHSVTLVCRFGLEVDVELCLDGTKLADGAAAEDLLDLVRDRLEASPDLRIALHELMLDAN